MAEHTNPDDHFPDHNPSVAHDRGEEDVKSVSGFGIGLAISIVLVVFAMWGLFEWFYLREDQNSPVIAPPVLSEKPQLPPEPRLQAEPRLDLKALREGEDTILTTYAWIDPSRGIARIPVEDAIKIVAARGLPSRPSAGLADENGVREIPSVASSGRTPEKIAQ